MRCSSSRSRRGSFSLSPLPDYVMFGSFIAEPWLLSSPDQLGCCEYLRCVDCGLIHTCWLSCLCDLDYCRLPWNRFGHDRAKNDSGSCFSPVKALIAGLLHAHNGLSSDCIRLVNEGLIFLINLVCLGTTQTELVGWLSSPQPLNSTGREVRT